jgi:hypothetical protein
MTLAHDGEYSLEADVPYSITNGHKQRRMVNILWKQMFLTPLQTVISSGRADKF